MVIILHHSEVKGSIAVSLVLTLTRGRTRMLMLNEDPENPGGGKVRVEWIQATHKGTYGSTAQALKWEAADFLRGK